MVKQLLILRHVHQKTHHSKGCFVYCTDKETRDYFKANIGHKIADYKLPPIKMLKAADHKKK